MVETCVDSKRMIHKQMPEASYYRKHFNVLSCKQGCKWLHKSGGVSSNTSNNTARRRRRRCLLFCLLYAPSKYVGPTLHNAWFMVSRGIQTSISVPVKGFFSNFECELLWGVVQLGQDHGAPLAPCSGAQECTGCAQSAHFPQLFCLLS